ncbi:MAG: nucleotidyltransferase family protein [[Clostridium] innocuum]
MTYSDFLQACISRRYPRSSIQRSLTHILTHTDKQEIDALPPCDFLRILAFNDTGRACLRELKQKNSDNFHLPSDTKGTSKDFFTNDKCLRLCISVIKKKGYPGP